MFHSLYRYLPYGQSYKRMVVSLIYQNASTKSKYDEQINCIKLSIENNLQDWTLVKNNILSKQGHINQKNIDAVMLKYMISSKHLDAALSFSEHLRTASVDMSLGSLNGLLGLYTEMGKKNTLSKDHKQFILETYKFLYDKYKVLDFITSERLLQALCIIDEWEKALKVLADIHLSSTPSHSAYSTVVATLFRLNKKKKALELIEESLEHKRPLLENAYNEWINYIMRKFKDKNVIEKHLDEICSHVAKYCVIIDSNTAFKLNDIYKGLNWNAQFTRIRKQDGQCNCCKESLDSLILSNEEFNTLQQNVKDKLIVGSDLFIKSSPEELERFLGFIKRTAPYDIVLDALNICYALGKGSNMDRMNLLNHVVKHFVNEKKKILVLGRRHMLKWQIRNLESITSKTYTFLTEDLSQDDPYFITAAFLSGPHTDILSKDLLRGHKFLLNDERLRNMFKRWQWQHQWMMFFRSSKGVIVQPPLKFAPCAQKKNNAWHLPYQKEASSESTTSISNDGTPDLSSWLCLRPKVL